MSKWYIAGEYSNAHTGHAWVKQKGKGVFLDNLIEPDAEFEAYGSEDAAVRKIVEIMVDSDWTPTAEWGLRVMSEGELRRRQKEQRESRWKDMFNQRSESWIRVGKNP